MSITAPNTPKTSWVRDKGVVIVTTTDIFIDELGNFFIDENGDNLLDSISTDGNAPAHDWDNIDNIDTSWSNSFEVKSTVSRRITVDNNVRVTENGDTRVSNNSDKNKKSNTQWSEDEY